MSERIRVNRVAEMLGLSPRAVQKMADKISSAAQFGPRTVTFREQAVLEWLPYFNAGDFAESDTSGPFGLIYAIQGTPEGPVKIGFSTPKALNRRLLTLQTGSPYVLRILAQAPGYMSDERKAHASLAVDRMAGEWFAWSDRTSRFVQVMVEGRGIAAAIESVST